MPDSSPSSDPIRDSISRERRSKIAFFIRRNMQRRVPSSGPTTLFLLGAVGVEMFNGRYEQQHGAMNNTYMLGTALEELLEMAGSGLCLVALVSRSTAEWVVRARALLKSAISG